jgi:signal transduction histidine kinase
VDGLSGDHVNAVFEDREGTIWVATREGLDRFRELPITRVSTAQGLSGAHQNSIPAARDGTVWIGTEDGLNRWNDGRVTVYRRRTDPGLPDDRIRSLFEDERGRIWVSTAGGIVTFDGDRFTAVPLESPGFVQAIAGDGNGGIWLSSFEQGVGVVHVVGGRVVERMPWEAAGGKGPSSGLVTDPGGGVWIGLIGGAIVRFEDGRIRQVLSTEDGLAGGRLMSVQPDRDGALWAAAERGLSRIANGRIATMTVANGLPCNAVHWVLADDESSYWMHTRCGLVRIPRGDVTAWTEDPTRSVRATVFDASDGVPLFAFSEPSTPRAAKAVDGRIWFGAGDAIGVVDPRHVRENTVIPPVHIERITVDGRSYDPSSRPRLPPLVRDVAIEYTALSLTAPEKIRFRYRLEGQDADWTEVVNQRRVQYSNLRPGDYRFRVLATNNSGLWNDRDDGVAFSIAPTYYQTRWFRAAIAVGVFALLWVAYRLRIRQVARQFNRTLEARVSERMRIARELHDTLLQSFHGLLLRFQTALYLLPDRPAEAKEKLAGAIEHAAKAITEGRDAVQGLRASTVVRNDLAVAIRTLGDELATHASALQPPTFSVAVEGQTRDLHPIVRDEIYKIATEALRNAFRHAQAGRVEVDILYDDEEFRLRVRDDGKGIDAAVLANQGLEGHYGLRGMPERAALIGGKLAVWSEAGAGTEVERRLPASIVYATSPRRTWWARLLAPKTPANVRGDAS